VDDQRFDLIAWLRNLPDEQEQAENSVIATNDPQRRVLRLVAGRLPPDKAEEARERVRREARKKKGNRSVGVTPNSVKCCPI